MEVKYRIGYIDEDKSQVKLYKRKLREYGFEVMGYEFRKGMSLDELMHQVYNSNIDLLMIDYKLNESNIIPFNGDKVEKHIYENKPLFPHIIFTNKVDQAEPEVDDLKIIIDKESVFSSDEKDNSKSSRFVELLSKSIEQYKNLITKKKNLIADLLEKERTQELNAKENDLLLSTQRELQSLDKGRLKAIPEQLTSMEILGKLSDVRQEAEAYIESLLAQDDLDESKN